MAVFEIVLAATEFLHPLFAWLFDLDERPPRGRFRKGGYLVFATERMQSDAIRIVRGWVAANGYEIAAVQHDGRLVVGDRVTGGCYPVIVGENGQGVVVEVGPPSQGGNSQQRKLRQIALFRGLKGALTVANAVRLR